MINILLSLVLAVSTYLAWIPIYNDYLVVYLSCLVIYVVYLFMSHHEINTTKATDTLQSLGMLGTVVGMVFVMISLKGTSISSVDQLAEVIGSMIPGIGVAFMTTLTGIVLSLIYEVRRHYLKKGYSV